MHALERKVWKIRYLFCLGSQIAYLHETVMAHHLRNKALQIYPDRTSNNFIKRILLFLIPSIRCLLISMRNSYGYTEDISLSILHESVAL